MTYDENGSSKDPFDETQGKTCCAGTENNILHKPGTPFIMGPIPLDWVAAVGHLSGKILHVGLALFYLAGLEKSNKVVLSNSLLRTLGVARNVGYRALQALEQARLVTVVRHRGRNSVVTILPAPDGNSANVIQHDGS